jgi:hypothetical protein
MGNIDVYTYKYVIIIDYYMAFFILPLLSARDLDIGPDITYFARADYTIIDF